MSWLLDMEKEVEKEQRGSGSWLVDMEREADKEQSSSGSWLLDMEKEVENEQLPAQSPQPQSPIKGAGEARMQLEEKSAVTVDDLKNAVGSVADHAKRAVTGTSAGLGNVGASLAYNAGWALDEYVNAVNSGANAVAKKVIGKPLISEEGVNPLSIAALKTGDYIGSLAEKTTELGLEGREPTIYDAIAQAIGSTAGFMIPGSAVAKAANLGKVGTAIAYGSAKGGLEAGTEGGNVWREQLRQGATPEEARSAARKDALLQLPLNVASDAVGSLIGDGGGILRKMISRGLPEAIQETGQGVLSDKLSQRKDDGTPYTWGDVARAVPEMASKIPETMYNEGLPAFISAALIGGGEGIHGKYAQAIEQKQDVPSARPALNETEQALRQHEEQTTEARPTLDEIENNFYGNQKAETGQLEVKRPTLDEIEQAYALKEDVAGQNSAPSKPLIHSDIQTESGRSFLDADPSELLIRNDGSPALGRIDVDDAKRAGIVPGDVNVNAGLLQHVEKEHGKQIRNAGYENVQGLIADVLTNYGEIRQGVGDSVLLVKRVEHKKSNPTAAVELVPDGEVYRMKTAWLARDGYLDKRKLLSVRSGTPTIDPDSDLASLSANPDSQGDSQRWNARQEGSFINESIALNVQNINGFATEAEASPRTSETSPATRRSVEDDVQRLPASAPADNRRFFEPQVPTREEGEAAPSKPVTIAEIRQAVEKLVPWRHGKTGRDNLGLFKVEPEVVRSKNRNDVSVAMHEVGHFLDKRLGLRSSKSPGAEQELADNGRVASNESYTDDQVRAEGVAQFFLHYAVDEQQAREKFPEYYQEFETALAARPELAGQVAAVKGLVSSYYRQTGDERLEANIIRGSDKLARPIAEKAKQLGQVVYDDWVDGLAPLQRVTEDVRKKMGVKHLEDDMNLYARARTAAGFKGKADQDSKPFMSVIEGLKPEDHKLLSGYMAASRALNYRAKGMEPGLGTTIEEERESIANTPEHVKDAAARLRGVYNDMVQRTLVQTGIMSKEQFDYLQKEWPDYVPFVRVDTNAMMEHDVNVFMRGSGKSLANLGNPIKKATGVGNAHAVYPIEDPLEAMLRNIGVFHSLAARNEVGKTMMQIAKVEGMGRFAEKVSGPGEKGDSVFYVWNEGKREYYATDPDVYSALMRVNENAKLNPLVKPLIVAADWFKMGTTRYNPAFALFRNLPRDAWESAINSESRMLPIANSIKGLLFQHSKDPKIRALIEEAINEGVLYSGITELRDTSPGGLARTLTDAFKEGGAGVKTYRKVRDLFEWVGKHNEAIEVAPKLHEYLFLRSKGVPKQEAAMRAREVNVDFARAGKIGRNLNRYTAFFNAQVQGLDKVARTVKARPIETAFKAFLFAGIPSLIAWGLGNLGDDDDRKEYEEFPKQQKDMYWHFKMGETWVKLPKPNAYGVMGSLVERVLDSAFKKDPAAFRGGWATLWDEVSPPAVPNIFMSALEASTNYSFFTDRPIVPRKLEGLPPEMQFTESTSEVSKATSKYLFAVTGKSVSPMQIDHVLRSIGGTVGMEIVKTPDLLLKDKNSSMVENKALELPGVRSLVRAPFAKPFQSSESVDRFYELSQKTGDARARFEIRQKSGEAAAPNKDVLFSQVFDGASKQLSNMRKHRAAIQRSPQLSIEQKRQYMDKLDVAMVDVARNVLQHYDRYEMR